MSSAIAVYHGPFGRASVYHLDRPMVRHTHREGHLIFHVAGPAERLTTPGGSYPISPDSGVAVNPWEPHSYEARMPTGGTAMLVIYINPSWFETRRAGAAGPLYFGSPTIVVDFRLGGLQARLVTLLLDGGPAPMLEPVLFEFVEACFQATVSAAREREAPRVNDFRIRKSLRLLSACMGNELDLRFVAAESGLSRPHFFKLFHDQVGVPPKLFWNTLRMERALSALTETPLPITQIGLDLGFASSSSFSRFFASNVGLAPAVYRRAVRVLAA
jgi:AraC-like DNA-binding protein